MVTGCLAWQQRGLTDTPATIRKATDAYQVDQDLTGRWLEECTSSNSNGEETIGDLYLSYKAWCLDGGLKPATKIDFGRRLGERGYTKRPSNGRNIWRGLTLSDLRPEGYARMEGGY